MKHQSPPRQRRPLLLTSLLAAAGIFAGLTGSGNAALLSIENDTGATLEIVIRKSIELSEFQTVSVAPLSMKQIVLPPGLWLLETKAPGSAISDSIVREFVACYNGNLTDFEDGELLTAWEISSGDFNTPPPADESVPAITLPGILQASADNLPTVHAPTARIKW